MCFTIVCCLKCNFVYSLVNPANPCYCNSFNDSTYTVFECKRHQTTSSDPNQTINQKTKVRNSTMLLLTLTQERCAGTATSVTAANAGLMFLHTVGAMDTGSGFQIVGLIATDASPELGYLIPTTNTKRRIVFLLLKSLQNRDCQNKQCSNCLPRFVLCCYSSLVFGDG